MPKPQPIDKATKTSQHAASLIEDLMLATIAFAAARSSSDVENSYVNMQKAKYELARHVGTVERLSGTVTDRLLKF